MIACRSVSLQAFQVVCFCTHWEKLSDLGLGYICMYAFPQSLSSSVFQSLGPLVPQSLSPSALSPSFATCSHAVVAYTVLMVSWFTGLLLCCKGAEICCTVFISTAVAGLSLPPC